ncbi:MAG: hypothetical protein ACK5JS_03100 [Mangrovibacterium sp.]
MLVELCSYSILGEFRSEIKNHLFAGKGLAMAIAEAYKKEIGKAKMMVDCGMVAIDIANCDLTLNSAVIDAEPL